MRLPRPFRLITALMVLLSVLFMQLATAAHACPQPVQREQAAMHMAGCPQHAGDAHSALCDSHCQAASQSLDKPAPPDVAPFLAAALASTGSATACAATSGLSRASDLFSTRINAPPLPIRHCCLRI